MLRIKKSGADKIFPSRPEPVYTLFSEWKNKAGKLQSTGITVHQRRWEKNRKERKWNMPNRRKDESMKKTRILRVRVDDILYEMIQSAAEDAGITISEYIRRQLVHGKVDIHCHIVADFPTLEKIAQELSAIGNNLNQLTRYFHMGGIRSKQMQDESLRCINEVMKMRKEVMELGGEYRGYHKTSRK